MIEMQRHRHRWLLTGLDKFQANDQIDIPSLSVPNKRALFTVPAVFQVDRMFWDGYTAELDMHL
jgi:hypothetical protein